MSSFKIPQRDLLGILQSELLLTLGCTDPAAIGFAASAAVSCRRERSITKIEIFLDINILKNANSVIIPGTGRSGISLAAAIGLLNNSYAEGVLIFENLTEEIIKEADSLLKSIPFYITRKEGIGHIFVEVKVYYNTGDTSSALIEYKHDNLVCIKDNNKVIMNNNDKNNSQNILVDDIPPYEIPELIQLVKSFSDEELNFLDSAGHTNLLVADEGLELSPGSGIGSWLKSLYSDERDNNWPSVIMKSRYKVAAATDARMGGVKIPVMACGGSGNHGLTYFITLNEVLSDKGVDSFVNYRHSAAFGLLLLHYIKQSTGILTPMCGCAMAAGMAAAAALTWSLGGSEKSIINSMNYVFGFLGGIICDGAKKECSLKTSLSSQVAIESALLSLDGKIIDSEAGLFAGTLSSLLEHLRTIHVNGMSELDSEIVDILLAKNSIESNQI